VSQEKTINVLFNAECTLCH